MKMKLSLTLLTLVAHTYAQITTTTLDFTGTCTYTGFTKSPSSVDSSAESSSRFPTITPSDTFSSSLLVSAFPTSIPSETASSSLLVSESGSLPTIIPSDASSSSLLVPEPTTVISSEAIISSDAASSSPLGSESTTVISSETVSSSILISEPTTFPTIIPSGAASSSLSSLQFSTFSYSNSSSIDGASGISQIATGSSSYTLVPPSSSVISVTETETHSTSHSSSAVGETSETVTSSSFTNSASSPESSSTSSSTSSTLATSSSSSPASSASAASSVSPSPSASSSSSTSSSSSSSSDPSSSSTSSSSSTPFESSSSSSSSSSSAPSSSSISSTSSFSSISSTSSDASATTSLSAIEQAVLDRHNYYRGLHGVPEFNWNPDLVSYANDYIEQISNTAESACSGTLVHSSRTGKNYGENLAYGNIDGVLAVDLWYEENTYYNYTNPDSSTGTFEQYGHFTQLVWKASTDLGCVIHDCGSGRIYVICEYYPQGNIFLANGDPYYFFKENVLPPVAS